MFHHIIAKFNEQVTDKAALIAEIDRLYSTAAEIEGVHGCRVIPNCVDRSNRYDVMIRIEMDADKLSVWDASDLHHVWKEKYGSLLEKKAIFDSIE